MLIQIYMSSAAGSFAALLVAVSASAGVEAARTAAPSAEVAPAATAATTAGSPATAFSVVRQPSATILAVTGIVASHFPIRAAARCVASVTAGPSVASIIGTAAATAAPATLTVDAAPAAEPVSLAVFVGRSRDLFVSVA
jgi:hypothetical protein